MCLIYSHSGSIMESNEQKWTAKLKMIYYAQLLRISNNSIIKIVIVCLLEKFEILELYTENGYILV